MATSYPGTIQTFTNPSGTSSLATGPDHAALHSIVNDTLGSLQSVLGTTGGTAIISDFLAGDKAVRLHAGRYILGTAGGTMLDIPDTQGSVSNYLQIETSTGTIPPSLNAEGTSPNLNLALSAQGNGTITPISPLTGTITNSLFSGGTINNATLGTPVVNHFTSSGTSLPTKADAGLAPTVGTLSDSAGGTIAINAALAQVFELTLGTTSGNRTLAAPANPTDGQAIAFRFKQNSNNTGTIVFNSIYRMNQGGTPSLGTQSTWNYTAFRYNATDSKWDHQGNSLGII